MAKKAKKYVPGGGGKPLNVDLEEEDFKNLDTILKDIEKTRGKNEATDAAATRWAFRYLAEHINGKTIE